MTCDRCGKDITVEYYDGEGGNCTVCGENLCKQCAGDWDEDGACGDCQEVGGSVKDRQRYAYSIKYVDDSHTVTEMGQLWATDKNDAITRVWRDVMSLDREDEFFNGTVEIYDVRIPQRVYYCRG